MSVGGWIGVALAVIGVVEFGVFGVLARTNANIARRRRFLYLNAAANILIGVLLILIFG